MAESNNTKNVMVGKFKAGGYAFRAPLGTILPADATAALDDAFKNLGFLNPDGVTETVKTDSEDFKDANGDVIHVVNTGTDAEFQMTFVESLNPEVLKTVYGESAVSITNKKLTEGTKIKVTVSSAGRTPGAYVFEMIEDGNNVRLVVPNGVVSEVGEVSYKGKELIEYKVTLKAVTDSNGNLFYKHIQLNDGDK